MQNITVGTLVKSLDFPSRSDCYMIGEVVAINDKTNNIECKLIKAVSLNEQYDIDTETFTTPINHMFEDLYEGVGGRIQILQDA